MRVMFRWLSTVVGVFSRKDGKNLRDGQSSAYVVNGQKFEINLGSHAETEKKNIFLLASFCFDLGTHVLKCFEPAFISNGQNARSE